tara:strand:- start:337 stop:705 length:369 start_codon:yes stop_codon:yes gene_type:complete
MNAEEIINFNKKALYSSLTSKDTSSRFFNKTILHYAATMEIFSFTKTGGISYEKLCLNIPKALGSRSSIQNLLNEGLDKKLLLKIESNKDKRIKNYFLNDSFYQLVVDWIKAQKNIYNNLQI